MESLIKETRAYLDLLSGDIPKLIKGNKTATVKFRRNLRHIKRLTNALKIASYDAEISCR